MNYKKLAKISLKILTITKLYISFLFILLIGLATTYTLINYNKMFAILAGVLTMLIPMIWYSDYILTNYYNSITLKIKGE